MIELLFSFLVLIVWIAIGKIAVFQTMLISNDIGMERILIILAWPRYWKYRYKRYPPV